MAGSSRSGLFSRAAWLSLVAAGLAIVAATWRILAHDDVRRAGLGVAGAGLGLLLGVTFAHRSPAQAWLRRWWFADAIMDRLFDGAILGSIAWVSRETQPAIAAGALVALGTGFLGSYVRARGASLGYEVEESVHTRGLRYAVLAIGLLLDGLAWAVWTVAVLSTIAALVRTSQVAKEERA